jgi:urease accessory protein
MAVVLPRPASITRTGEIHLGVEAGPGGRPLTRALYSRGVLSVRPTRWGAYLVSSGAHPIGGDRLAIDVALDAATVLEIRSTGATIARPGPDHTPSSAVINARVGPAATLSWLPQAGVAVDGADHCVDTRIFLADSSRLFWWDSVQLGRHGEGPGAWRSRTRVERAGRAVLDTEISLGPGAPSWTSSAGFAGSPAMVSVLIVDPQLRPPSGPTTEIGAGAQGTLLEAGAPGAVLVSAWGASLPACRRVALCLMGRLGVPAWAPSVAGEFG